jgi:Tol biopolymer transport system component/imidazolonepropionase-like amidohydrolase
MQTRLLTVSTLLAITLGTTILAEEPPAKDEGRPDYAADINKPRPDARKISFPTTEGTWMSVDVSPDGRTLVFDLLGDVYRIPVGGGDAKALTRGPAFDSHPRFSPDGRTIAFTSDRSGIENVWLMDADGRNPRAVTSEKDAYVRSAVWTPDGQYLIARKEDGKRAGIPPVELWIYHREGGGGIKLTSSDELNNAGGAAVSPDGRYIYFSARQRKFSYVPNLSDGLWQIWRYDRELAETLPVAEGFGGAARPAISPDGKTMTYISRRDDDTVIVARDLSTGAERILARGVTHDEMEGFTQMDLWPNYAFLPDGKSLVFSNHGRIVRLELGSGTTRDVPFTAEVEQWAAPRVAWQEKVASGPVEARILRWPNQSPDGKWIVFEAFGRAWMQALSNGKPSGAPRRLTADSPSLAPREYAPTFSPDGRWVAFVSWSDAAGGHLWKAPAAPGSSPVKLTRVAGHYANPAWSPGGDRIAVLRGSGLEFRKRQPEDEEFFEIEWLDAAGGDLHPVTTVKLAQSMKFHPQAFWSANGSRIYYRDPIEPKKPTDDPKNDLVSVRLDGTDRRRHLRFPPVDDLVPSPDERWVVFTSRDNVYVTALPEILTKEPAEVGLKEGAVPIYRLSDDAGGYVGWSGGGRTITWALGPTFYRLPLDSAIDFAREQKRKAEEKAKKKAEPKSGDEPKPAAEKDEKEGKEPRVPKAETIALSLSVPRPAPRGSFVLRGARVVTMRGDAVLENADVVVTNDRIAAVGPSGSVPTPAGARTFDGTGTTVIPGLVDTHAHLHYSGFELFPETKWEYVANLAYGVTTVYDPSAPSLDVFAQAQDVEAGRMLGPRVYSSGDVLYGGQQTDIFAEVGGLDDAKHQVRRMKAYGARMIKVYQQPRRAQRMWFAEACRDEHMLLTAEGAGELNTDLTMVLDGFTAFEHALPVTLRRDIVDFVAKSQTFYTPTLLVAYGGPWGELYYWQTANPHDDPKLNRFVPHEILDAKGRRHPWIWPSEYHFPTVAHGAAEVLRAGGNVSLGAHGQLQGLGVHWEIWAMAGEGAPQKGWAMTPMEALRASTILAAEKIGISPDLGSIEEGKLADFVVLDANPLDDIHNTTKIRWVVKNGAVFEAATMKQVWPREEPPPTFFWK